MIFKKVKVCGTFVTALLIAAQYKFVLFPEYSWRSINCHQILLIQRCIHLNRFLDRLRMGVGILFVLFQHFL
jgi:hypothetical protein